MRQPWRDSIQLPAPPRDLRLGRVLSAEAARQQDVDDRVRAAYERGRIEGEQALGELLVRQRQETQELFHGVLQSLRNAVPQVVRDCEQTLAQLALEIARKVVADLPVTAQVIEGVVREALAQVEQAAEFTVQVHPADLELLRQLQSPLLQGGADNRQIQFQATPEVSRGGCLVHTRFGTVDARRETKFDLIRRSLHE